MHAAADKVVLHFAAAPEETCDMVVLSGPITHFVRSVGLVLTSSCGCEDRAKFTDSDT